jgi:hypothetical protein
VVRKILQSALCICLAPLLVAQQADTSPDTVRLSKDVAIHLKLDQDISSATVREGQNVRYVVTDDVIADGVVVIPAGTAVYRKVATVQRSESGKSCGSEINGWFALDDPTIRSSNGRPIKLTLLPPDAFPKKPMSPREKALLVLAVPLQIPAFAILVAAPIVLIPIGIASGIHDSLHKPGKTSPKPAPTVASPIQTVSVPSTMQLSPQTSAPEPTMPTSPTPPMTPTTVETLPLQGTAAQHRSAPAPSASVPCQVNAQDEVWKTSGARVQTYYPVRNYTVRASLPPLTPAHEMIKETQ